MSRPPRFRTTTSTFLSWVVLLVVVSILSSSAVVGFNFETFFRSTTSTTTTTTTTQSKSYPANGIDADYPYCFTGRLWFRPAIVKVPETKDELTSSSISVVSLFGYTIGGVVALEYDSSPVGPYKEYVTMGAIVSSSRKQKGLILGQWGSQLYVSTQEAETVCQQLWNVPAQWADITFSEQDNKGDNNNKQSPLLHVSVAPNPQMKTTNRKQTITVHGWSQTRILSSSSSSNVKRYPSKGIPVFWTPSIKALWAPLLLVAPATTTTNDSSSSSFLPLHKLRLSASAIRLKICYNNNNHTPTNTNNNNNQDLGIPIPIGLVVDNVLIEISKKIRDL